MSVESGGSGAPMSDRMQSLLSRAVEDQLSEQRQIAGVLADLRAQLQRITSDIAAMRGEAGSSGSSDAALASVSADVREAVRLLGERLDGVGRLVQQRGTDLAELRAVTGQLQASVRGHGEALAGVSSGLAALPAFGERIGGLHDNLAALHERLAGLDQLGQTLSGLQQRVEGVDQGLRELRSAFAAIGARMAELPQRADLEALAQPSAAPLGELDGRLGGIEAAVAAVAAQVSALSERPPAAHNVDALRAELARFADATHEDSAGVQDRLAGLDRQVGQLLEAMDALTSAEPEEAAQATEPGEEEYAEDPVLAELADLREALLGEDGLASRVEAAGAEDVDARVRSAVGQAVAASEERLTAHIDEAVLALAEALLRRRGTRATPSAPPTAAGPAAPEQMEPAPESGPEPDRESEPDDAPAAEAADTNGAGHPDVTPWQTPAGSSPEDAPAPPEDANRRRRPWWRPGD